MSPKRWPGPCQRGSQSNRPGGRLERRLGGFAVQPERLGGRTRLPDIARPCRRPLGPTRPTAQSTGRTVDSRDPAGAGGSERERSFPAGNRDRRRSRHRVQRAAHDPPRRRARHIAGRPAGADPSGHPPAGGSTDQPLDHIPVEFEFGRKQEPPARPGRCSLSSVLNRWHRSHPCGVRQRFARAPRCVPKVVAFQRRRPRAVARAP